MANITSFNMFSMIGDNSCFLHYNKILLKFFFLFKYFFGRKESSLPKKSDSLSALNSPFTTAFPSQNGAGLETEKYDTIIVNGWVDKWMDVTKEWIGGRDE